MFLSRLLLFPYNVKFQFFQYVCDSTTRFPLLAPLHNFIVKMCPPLSTFFPFGLTLLPSLVQPNESLCRRAKSVVSRSGADGNRTQRVALSASDTSTTAPAEPFPTPLDSGQSSWLDFFHGCVRIMKRCPYVHETVLTVESNHPFSSMMSSSSSRRWLFL